MDPEAPAQTGLAPARRPATMADFCAWDAHDRAAHPPLADLCAGDPLDLDADPRLRLTAPEPTQPCGALCTPWCLGSHS